MIIKTANDKSLVIAYSNDGVLSAHTKCRVNQPDMELQIVDLFSTKDYADMSFEDMLLDEVITYAREHELTSISYIVGPEPFNPEPHLTQEQVIQWYLAQGFEQESGALGAIKMVYQIPPID